MKLALLLLAAVALEAVSALPFPFELGGDRNDYSYRPYRPVYSNGRQGRRNYPRRQYGRPRYSAYNDDDDDDSFNSKQDDDESEEDRKNREKVEKALAAQRTVVNTVMPLVQGMIPGFGNMVPRMRRSPEMPSEAEEGDQLSLPSETSLLMVPVATGVEQPQAAENGPQKTPFTIMMPNNPKFPPVLVAQQRSDDEERPQGVSVFPLPAERGPREVEENDAPRPQEGLLRSLPSIFPALRAQLVPPSLVPPSPHATIQSGTDDKIYFAVDRKTILDFLSALFGGETRSALAAALHENSVHHSRNTR